MKLFFSPASPFVRKVLVLAHERGIRDQIECVPVVISPITTGGAVASHNPSGNIPTLALADGSALYDSRVIVEYLDGLPGGPSLLPAAGPARYATLRLQSLADELTDAAVLLRYETFLRPPALRWPEWIDGQWRKVRASLDVLEHAHLPELEGRLDLGTIAVGCALGYLELRFPDEDWRASRPGLAAWYAGFSERPSMVATRPV